MSAVSALLEGLIDYAGLFPPAKLPMQDAVRNFATYRSGAQRSALGRFIVPMARLAEFESAYAALPSNAAEGWRLSVIASAQPAEDWANILAFNTRHSAAKIVAVETKAASAAQVLEAVGGLPPLIEAWVEISPAAPDLAPLLDAVKSTGRGAKLRTGGVTPDAFPPSRDVLRFMSTCRDAGVVFKATAGLHHPIRGDYRLTYEPDSQTGTMFGFLNLFLAATLMHLGGTEADALALLEEKDAGKFTTTDAEIRWRDHRFGAEQIHAARQQFCRSFGSCSFTEPVEGLQELQWL